MLSLLIRMLPLVLLALAGYVLNRFRWIDATFNRQLSLIMFNLFYPCLIISAIVRNFTWASLLQNSLVPAGTAGILLTGWLIGLLLRPFLKKHPPETRRSFHFICLMNNYSFLPILMAASLWGEKAVALIIFGSLGAELCVWTLGVATLTGQKKLSGFLRHVMSLPMGALLFTFMILGVQHFCKQHACIPAEGTLPHEILTTLLETCRMAGAATIPASALVCGSRIAMLHPSKMFSLLIAGISTLRLVIIPALCIGGLMLIPMSQEIRRVLMLLAVQPAAMVSVPLAEAYGGDADFTAAAILATHILCLVTIPLWLAIALSS